MAKLRRLTGREVIKILEGFGYEVIRIKGSHHRLRRVIEGESQFLSVPVHGKKPLAIPTLKSIYRDACDHISEEELKPHFYTE